MTASLFFKNNRYSKVQYTLLLQHTLSLIAVFLTVSCNWSAFLVNLTDHGKLNWTKPQWNVKYSGIFEFSFCWCCCWFCLFVFFFKEGIGSEKLVYCDSFTAANILSHWLLGVFQSKNILLASFHFCSIYFKDFFLVVWRSASIQLKDTECLSEVAEYSFWLSEYQRDSCLYFFRIGPNYWLSKTWQVTVSEIVNENSNYPLLCLSGQHRKSVPTLKYHSALSSFIVCQVICFIPWQRCCL